MQNQIESIMSQVRKLGFDERLKLIQRIAADLMPRAENLQPHQLVYGKYSRPNAPMSTEDDFKLAEWQPMKRI